MKYFCTILLFLAFFTLDANAQIRSRKHVKKVEHKSEGVQTKLSQQEERLKQLREENERLKAQLKQQQCKQIQNHSQKLQVHEEDLRTLKGYHKEEEHKAHPKQEEKHED